MPHLVDAGFLLCPSCIRSHIDSDSADGKYTLIRAAGFSKGSTQYTADGLACGDIADRRRRRLEDPEPPSVDFVVGKFKGDDKVRYDQSDILRPSKCRWTTTVPGYLRPFEGAARSMYDPKAERFFQYDYTFEVCQRPGTCSPTDFECINAYTLVGVGNPSDGGASQF